MKQIASNSQTLTFVKNESNTSQVLYQHPKKSEMGVNRIAQIKANARDFGVFIVIAIICWAAIEAALKIGSVA